MIEEISISCPYCGESFGIGIDCSTGSQDFIEDCQVCCRPIEFSMTVDPDCRLLGLEARRDDD